MAVSYDEAEKVAKALIVWMDVFGSINQRNPFPPAPSTAPWGAYSAAEQATARLAAQAVLRALSQSPDRESGI